MILSSDAVKVRDRLREFEVFPVSISELTAGFTSGARLMRALTELDREGLVRVEGEQVWFNETANLQHMIGLPPEGGDRGLSGG